MSPFTPTFITAVVEVVVVVIKTIRPAFYIRAIYNVYIYMYITVNLDYYSYYDRKSPWFKSNEVVV